MKPETLIHGMLENSMQKMRIAAILPGGIYSYMAAAKKVHMESSGPDITNPLMIGGNPNVGPATYYDHVPVAQTNELATVSYEMTRIVGTYVISDQEVSENMGEAKIVDIAATKMQALEISFKKYQRKCAAGTNSGKDTLGLGNLFPKVNNSGTLGGINLATQELFRHSVYDYAGTLTADNIEDSFDDILLDLNNDEGGITVIFVGRKIFNLHRKAAKDNASVQFGAGAFGTQLANLGLRGTNHQGIPLVFDEQLNENDAYFINENELLVHILKSANMKMKELAAPYDQDVIGGRYIWEGQFCSWKNFRTHGYVTNRAA